MDISFGFTNHHGEEQTDVSMQFECSRQEMKSLQKITKENPDLQFDTYGLWNKLVVITKTVPFPRHVVVDGAVEFFQEIGKDYFVSHGLMTTIIWNTPDEVRTVEDLRRLVG